MRREQNTTALIACGAAMLGVLFWMASPQPEARPVSAARARAGAASAAIAAGAARPSAGLAATPNATPAGLPASPSRYDAVVRSLYQELPRTESVRRNLMKDPHRSMSPLLARAGMILYSLDRMAERDPAAADDRARFLKHCAQAPELLPAVREVCRLTLDAS